MVVMAEISPGDEGHVRPVEESPRPARVTQLHQGQQGYELGQPPEGWHIECRFREADDTPDREYVSGIPEEEQRYWVTREYFPAGTCWYQLGVTDGQDRTIYEPWQRVPLRP